MRFFKLSSALTQGIGIDRSNVSAKLFSPDGTHIYQIEYVKVDEHEINR